MTRNALHPIRLIFNTNQTQIDAIERFARENNITRAEAIRTLVRLSLDNLPLD